MTPKDLFGDRADIYARLRPTYPEALFDHLARLVARRDRAWDCGTGSGQTAKSLAARFGSVVATDGSMRQLAHFTRGPHLHPVAAAAERAPIRPRSVDLVTVSTAVHWFDRPRFYAEVRRVAREGAVLAVWSYFQSRITPEVSAVVKHYADVVLGEWWGPEIRLNRSAYRDLDFPFERLPWPQVEATTTMDLEDLENYMRTWSSSQAYARRHGSDPVAQVHDDLLAAWGDPGRERVITWPLHGAIGRIAG